MELPELNLDPKLLAGGLAAIILLVLVYSLVLPLFQTHTVNAYFEKNNLLPGETTNLIVEVTNLQSQDLDLVTVEVKAIDKTSIDIPESEVKKEQQYFGKGETKKFQFPIEVLNAREGTYSIEITVRMNGDIEKQRAILNVKGD